MLLIVDYGFPRNSKKKTIVKDPTAVKAGILLKSILQSFKYIVHRRGNIQYLSYKTGIKLKKVDLVNDHRFCVSY